MSSLTKDEIEQITLLLQHHQDEMYVLSREVSGFANKVQSSNDEDKEHSVSIRLMMTLAAQIGGFFLLWLLGSNTFSIDTAINQPSVRDGLEYIQSVERIYMAGSGIIVIIVISLLWLSNKPFVEQINVDIVLLCFVFFDLILLLFLVCQEGGLCRSMFLPVYFLIPNAYLTAERHGKYYRKRKLFVLLSILTCIYISYRYAAWAQPPHTGTNLQPAIGTFNLLYYWWPVNLTDFSTLAHRDYDEAVWYASCISALVPLIQILTLAFTDKLEAIKAKSRHFPSPSPDKNSTLADANTEARSTPPVGTGGTVEQ
ncbi:MAG: hypothetical protein LC754_13155 [Acidobacteria bacterium]|nr:hypothetical protein [Acidobacteriota bacterium]